MKRENMDKAMLAKLEKFLGKVDYVTKDVNKSWVKLYVYKCAICNSKVSRHYARHLQRKHKFEKDQAVLMESKMRVLYLWITSGDGNSYHRPLPCPKCLKWYMRLDNHMRDSHSKSYSASERADLLNVIREKEWGIENVCQAQKVTEIMKIMSANNFVRRHRPAQREGIFVPEEREHLPKNAILDCR